MIKVNYMGVDWVVYPPLSQIYLENSEIDLYDFLDVKTINEILKIADYDN
jgi:hypothetical protein